MATRISHSGPIAPYQSALERLSVALRWCRRITGLTTTAFLPHEPLDSVWDRLVYQTRLREGFTPDPFSREMPFICEEWPPYDLARAINNLRQADAATGRLVKPTDEVPPHTSAASQGISMMFVPADDEDGEALQFYTALGGTPSKVTLFEFVSQ
jgi:hypothetical protein